MRVSVFVVIAAIVSLACTERVDAGRTAAATAPPAQSRDLIGSTFDAKVVRVADGDTLEAIPAGQSRVIRIRLQGVDAPELGEPFSREAQAFVRTLLFDQRVRIVGHELDRYDRLVARVSASGKDASTELVRAGLACHSYARDAALASEESRARSAGVGFWAATAKKPGCVTRTAYSSRSAVGTRDGSDARPLEAVENPSAVSFRGNTSNRVYHTSTCPNFNCRNCTRVFASEAEAKAAGFRPAGDCARR